jgi:hypothetical protein
VRHRRSNPKSCDIGGVESELHERNSESNSKGNWIGNKGACAIADTIKSHKAVAALDLWGLTWFLWISQRREQDWRYWCISRRRRDQIPHVIGDLVTGRCHIGIESNQVGNEIGNDGAKAIADAINDHKVIATLDLSGMIRSSKSYHIGNEIGNEGAKAIAGAINDHKVIVKLDLSGIFRFSESYRSGNRIGAEGASAIATALIGHESLTSVTIDNEILLQECLSLPSIDLRSRSFSALDAVVVASLAMANSALTKLDLSGMETLFSFLNRKGTISVLRAGQPLLPLSNSNH